jgi:hypothetical protein
VSFKDDVFQRFWPLPQSMTLVRADVERVGRLVESEIGRTLSHLGTVSAVRSPFDGIESLFGGIAELASTRHFVLPTRSEWTVVWTDSPRCDGYDSLAYNLTRLHDVDTLYFSSSDTDGPFLAGTSFNYRERGKGGELSRSVYCCNQGSRWHFLASGSPLATEPTEAYRKRVKRERMNEWLLAEMLAGMGAEPWRERFYEIGRPMFEVRFEPRPPADANLLRVSMADVMQRSNRAPNASDAELRGPPSYLRGKTSKPARTGPAQHLRDGSWCGHGEPQFWIYDVHDGPVRAFEVHVPIEGDSGPPVVRLRHGAGEELLAYDARRHPASVFCSRRDEPRTRVVDCQRCGGRSQHVSVGFEVPADAASPDDTSWFALAVACTACGASGIVYDDETA